MKFVAKAYAEVIPESKELMEARWKEEHEAKKKYQKEQRQQWQHAEDRPIPVVPPLKEPLKVMPARAFKDPLDFSIADCGKPDFSRMNTEEAIQATLLDEVKMEEMLAATRLQAKTRGVLARKDTDAIAAEAYVKAATELSSRNLLADMPPENLAPRKKEGKFHLAPHAKRQEQKQDNIIERHNQQQAEGEGYSNKTHAGAPQAGDLRKNPVNKGMMAPDSISKGTVETILDVKDNVKALVTTKVTATRSAINDHNPLTGGLHIHSPHIHNPLSGAIGMYKEAVHQHVTDMEKHVKSVKCKVSKEVTHHVVDAHHYFHLTDNHTKKMHFHKHHSAKDVRVRI
jgi:hypothetical protein